MLGFLESSLVKISKYPSILKKLILSFKFQWYPCFTKEYLKYFLGSQVRYYSSFKERYNNNIRKNRFVEKKRAESEKLLDKYKGENNENGENGKEKK